MFHIFDSSNFDSFHDGWQVIFFIYYRLNLVLPDIFWITDLNSLILDGNKKFFQKLHYTTIWIHVRLYCV